MSGWRRTVALDDNESRWWGRRFFLHDDFDPGRLATMNLDDWRRWRWWRSLAFDDRYAVMAMGTILDDAAGENARGRTDQAKLSDRA